MKTIKVRKIGNSLGILLPKNSGVKDGDLLIYSKNDEVIYLDSSDTKSKDDRELIEKSFEAFEIGRVISEKNN